MRLIFTAEAEADLEAIGDYLAEDSVAVALAFTAGLRRACNEIAASPDAYPLLPRHPKLGFRRRVHKSYLIIYRIVDSAVYISHIIHGARDLDALLDS